MTRDFDNDAPPPKPPKADIGDDDLPPQEPHKVFPPPAWVTALTDREALERLEGLEVDTRYTYRGARATDPDAWHSAAHGLVTELLQSAGFPLTAAKWRELSDEVWWYT
jgi:hypothetical protein